MTRDENNRHCLSGYQLLLEFETAGARKWQVQDEACGRVWLFRFQELGSRVEDSHSKTYRGNEAGQCLPYAVIVIHHEDDGAVGVHDVARRVAAGSVKEKVVPALSSDAAHSRPRCASMMERQTANPMPIPFSFVVKKASKTFSGSFRPTPQSRISTRTVSGLCRFEEMKSFFGRSRIGSMASIALRTKLKSSCCNCERSPATGAGPLSRSVSMATCLLIVSPPRSTSTSPMTSFRSSSIFSRGACLKMALMRCTISPASLPSRTILSAASCALARLGGWADSHRRQA